MKPSSNKTSCDFPCYMRIPFKASDLNNKPGNETNPKSRNIAKPERKNTESCETNSEAPKLQALFNPLIRGNYSNITSILTPTYRIS